jgi:glycosyltransferase involved in cell wall biosynthesis
MRILTLNANLKGVGTYQRCFYFSRELARSGHQVTMVTVSPTSKYRARTYYKSQWIGEHDRLQGDEPCIRVVEAPNLGYKWLPGWGSGPLDILLRTRELMADQYDAVYGFEYQPNVAWPVYLTRRFRPYLYFSDWCDWHAGQSNWLRGIRLAHRVDAYFEERIRYIAAKVSVISPTLRDRAVAIGIPLVRVEWVKQGVDTEYIQDLPQDEIRQQLGIPLDRPVALAVNDGDMLRPIRLLSRAMQQNSSLMGMVVGNVAAQARDAAREFGIDDRVLWTGWVSDQDYPRYLAAADFFVLPVRDVLMNYARFPGKVLDFLAAGRPLVTNCVAEIGALVKDHNLGSAVVQNDESFIAAILEFASNRASCREVGQRARQLMVSEWRWPLRGPHIARIVEGQSVPAVGC